MGAKQDSKGCKWLSWFIVFVVLAVIAGAVALVMIKKKQNDKDNEVPTMGPPGAVVDKYSDALKTAMQFFDIQKSGKLVNNKISWRGDSGLKDGEDVKVDLSKGMYDAGDHMKFGFPMAFTATVLSWSILEYGDHMDKVDQLEKAQDSLKWITDYLVKAHPDDNVLYIQVGDPKADHECWNRPEDMTGDRPVIQVNTTAPGTEVAAETAAAMASASLVFKKSNPTYSDTLLDHAKKLFTFANENRGSYSKSIPDVQKFYNSTGYGDELLWAAGWLYHATGDNTYLDFVTGDGVEFAGFGKPSWFSWDSKLAGAQVLLSRLTFFGGNKDNSVLQKYKSTAEAVMCGLLPKSPTATTSRTKDGLIWISEWNALQHPVASSFLAVVYSDYMLTSKTAKLTCNGDSFKPADIRKFAISQIEYVLGNNPMKMSYLVGYGDNYPKYVHHRGASIPADAKPSCSDGFKYFKSSDPNPNVATGALVGGPFLNETYHDIRDNARQGEPSTYNSAVLVGLLSSLVTTSSVLESLTSYPAM
ncbi:PREDICTED: endoglucanase 10-like [Fragaria vesca subsp. vesca]|uniref:endoglucanase 10-like n=1 Tax=Fragaria vesca subsp. vesca TaxID=101020 RepID=UPI0002C36E0B|nr:PREDICTED: endoglucanase 10-like [Fragaria vesca subsp. vesca]